MGVDPLFQGVQTWKGHILGFLYCLYAHTRTEIHVNYGAKNGVRNTFKHHLPQDKKLPEFSTPKSGIVVFFNWKNVGFQPCNCLLNLLLQPCGTNLLLNFPANHSWQEHCVFHMRESLLRKINLIVKSNQLWPSCSEVWEGCQYVQRETQTWTTLVKFPVTSDMFFPQ